MPSHPSRVTDRRLAGGLLALAAFVLVLSAWIDDDAFVTLRTIDNLLDGRGAVWNPVERVQAYTHPLWMALNAVLIALTGRFELTLLLVSIALSLVSMALLVFRAASSVRWGCLLALSLLASKAFVDYATSGLEDPLTRCLAVLFVLALGTRRDGGHEPGAGTDGLLVLLASLATLCRPDAILIFLPALLARFDRGRWRRQAAAAGIGLLPLALWASAATFYYGSPFPNTAYAKLGAGVPRAGLVLQGGSYLLESLLRDTVTLALLGLALAWVWSRGTRNSRALGLGAVLYLLYVVWIGGGYMSGRFLGLPLLVTVTALATLEPPRLDRAATTRLAAAAMLLLVPRLVEPSLQDGVGLFGIGDERRTHHPYTGLVYALGPGRWPEHSLRTRGDELAPGRPTPETAIGMVGFYADPEVHLVDVYGLSEPLLARMPARIDSTFNRPRHIAWRPGHLRRPLPEGYLESLPTGENRIVDPDLHAYYDVLRLVTRGPLFSTDRLRAVLDLNLGRHDHLIDAYTTRHAELFRPARDESPARITAGRPDRRSGSTAVEGLAAVAVASTSSTEP